MNTRYLSVALALVSALACSGTSLLCVSPSPRDGQALLGLQVDQVVQRLGVPSSLQSGSQTLEFRYEQPADKGSFRVVFHEGKACFASAPSSARLGARAPSGKVYLGQDLAAAIAILGQPEGLSQGAHALCLQFAGTRISAAHGHVVGIERGE